MRLNVKALLIGLVLIAIIAMGAKPAYMAAMTAIEKVRFARLTPDTQAALARLRAELDAMGIPTFIGSTLRDEDEQAVLVASGHSATNRSWHRVGRAVDLYPRLADGKPDLQGRHVERFRRMHEVAQRHGWRGIAFNSDGSKRYITTSKGRVWDGGHLEYRAGMTWEQAYAAFVTRSAIA